MSEFPRGDGVREHRRADRPEERTAPEPSNEIPRGDGVREHRSAGSRREERTAPEPSNEIPWETSAEDVAEQRAEVAAEEIRVTVPGREQWEVDPTDAAEQESEVPIDEEEWR